MSGVGRIRVVFGVIVGDENLYIGRKDYVVGVLGYEDYIFFGIGVFVFEKNDGFVVLKVECVFIVVGGDFDVVVEVCRGEDGFGFV